MIFLMPLLIIFFVLMLISKLAGATISWVAVFIPLIIFLCIWGIAYLFGEKAKKAKKNKKAG